MSATRPATLLVLGSLVSGVGVAGLLCLVVFPGAVEAVITGSLLTGFGLGWALLAAASPRTGQPQRWAWLPALSMSATGLALIATAPGPEALSLLGWVWPPGPCTRRDLLADADASRTPGSRPRAALPGAGRTAPGERGRRAPHRRHGWRSHSAGDAGERLRGPGRSLHVNCHGAGSPTVVLEAGLSDSSVIWSRVLPRVARTTRVCAYDRAGQGWSEEGSLPHDAVQAAHDLHALLDAAGEAGPLRHGGTLLGRALCDDVRGGVPGRRRRHGPPRQLEPRPVPADPDHDTGFRHDPTRRRAAPDAQQDRHRAAGAGRVRLTTAPPCCRRRALLRQLARGAAQPARRAGGDPRRLPSGAGAHEPRRPAAGGGERGVTPSHPSGAPPRTCSRGCRAMPATASPPWTTPGSSTTPRARSSLLEPSRTSSPPSRVAGPSGSHVDG